MNSIMDIHFLKLNGVIKDKDNLEFQEATFLKLLADYGYRFSGKSEAFHNQQMLDDIQFISEKVNQHVLERMLVQHQNIFGPDSNFTHMKYTLMSAPGSAAFASITMNALPEECTALIKQYSELDWSVFDIFHSELGEALSNKII